VTDVLPSTPLLDVRRLAMSFRRRRVLDDVNFTVARGEHVALVGENGSGKSTLLKIIVGLLTPSSGAVHVEGRIGYCPQDPLVFEALSVEENFRYFASAYGLDRSGGARWMARRDTLLETFRFGQYLRTLVSELSGGTRQKLNLCVALLHEPDLLVLDEPYAGFDWETYLRFREFAEEEAAAGTAILVVTHLVYEPGRFHRVLELAGGRLS
jgi:ABC-type multidrug transport system ATPase subunit